MQKSLVSNAHVAHVVEVENEIENKIIFHNLQLDVTFGFPVYRSRERLYYS